jgi:hypothetical protein
VHFHEIETAFLRTTHCIKQSFIKRAKKRKKPLAILRKIYIIMQDKFNPKGGQAK